MNPQFFSQLAATDLVNVKRMANEQIAIVGIN
jgi:hypothetical protein